MCTVHDQTSAVDPMRESDLADDLPCFQRGERERERAIDEDVVHTRLRTDMAMAASQTDDVSLT